MRKRGRRDMQKCGRHLGVRHTTKRSRGRFFVKMAVLAALPALIWAGGTVQGSAPGVKTLGRVHISTEWMEEGDVPVRYLRPGDVLEVKRVIHMGRKAARAYLRIKVLLKGMTAAQQEDLLERMETSPEWHYQYEDGYFYCQEPADAGEQTVFSAKVQVPKQWADLQEEVCFCVSVLTEAAECDLVQPEMVGNVLCGWRQ